MKLNDIPIQAQVRGLPLEDDGQKLDYLSLPHEMAVYHMPVLPEGEELAGLEPGLALMDRLQAAAANFRADPRPVRFDLRELDARNLDFMNQLLGEGEVSIRHAAISARIQESILTGIWRVQNQAADYIEVADIPSLVLDTAFASSMSELAVDPSKMPAGIMNAAPVLAEIAAKVEEYRPGDPPHVINLSLLPLLPEDLAQIDRLLGRGPVTILSRGYGNCRITTTALRHTWRVQFFNSVDTLILDTLEIVDVPMAARADVEDIEQSAARLRELRETME